MQRALVGSSGADIIIRPPANSAAGTTSTPNGVVSNTTSGFVITINGRSAPATLLFSTEDGNLISAQGDAINAKKSMSSELVEFTPTGEFIGQFSVSPRNPGGAFRGASGTNSSLQFAAVNDITNTVEIWQVTT
jgi:hypothetical protein